MDESLAIAVFRRAHADKHVYLTHHHASNDARLLKRTKGEDVSPYRCPFSSLTGGVHFHCGHVPSMESVGTLAEAIRFFGQHPEVALTLTL